MFIVSFLKRLYIYINNEEITKSIRHNNMEIDFAQNLKSTID